MNNGYRYKGKPLTKESVSYVISHHTSTRVDDGPASTSTVAKHVLKQHMNKGGLPSENDDLEKMVHEALKAGSGQVNPATQAQSAWDIARHNHKILGSGKYWVYLYYFDKDRNEVIDSDGNPYYVPEDLWNRDNIFCWRCKIGKTEKNPEARIKAQTSGVPVPPKIPLLIRTDQHTELETAIHSILKLSGKHLKELQGKEWFDTNPQEVLNIYDWIVTEDYITF